MKMKLVSFWKGDTEGDVEDQSVDWINAVISMLVFIFKNTAGTESVRGFFSVPRSANDEDAPSRFPYLISASLSSLSWFIAPSILGSYIDFADGIGYGIIFLIMLCGFCMVFAAWYVAFFYGMLACSVLESDKTEFSLGAQLFLFVSITGITWIIPAAVMSVFDGDIWVFMCVFVLFFALRAGSVGAFWMCKGGEKTVPFTFCVVKLVVDVGTGLLGGFLFYLIMTRCGFIIETPEVSTLRNACLILGAFQNPLLMPLLPMLAPDSYRYL